jgi:hypothetical protein
MEAQNARDYGRRGHKSPIQPAPTKGLDFGHARVTDTNGNFSPIATSDPNHLASANRQIATSLYFPMVE